MYEMHVGGFTYTPCESPHQIFLLAVNDGFTGVICGAYMKNPEFSLSELKGWELQRKFGMMEPSIIPKIHHS